MKIWLGIEDIEDSVRRHWKELASTYRTEKFRMQLHYEENDWTVDPYISWMEVTNKDTNAVKKDNNW